MSEASPPKPPAIVPAPAPPPSRAAARGLSEGQKEALVIQALGRLNEQVRARTARDEGELRPSRELDAAPVSAQAPEEVEEQQTRALGQLLLRFFDGQGRLVTRLSNPIGKRLAKLYFESELGQQTRPEPDKTIVHPEQGLYYVLSRYQHRLRAELDGFAYESPELRLATLELLAQYERELRVAFLSGRSPELERVMSLFRGVLGDFLQKHLPLRLEAMAKQTIRVSKSARRAGSSGSQVPPEAFDDFRAEWERLFMQQMVFFCGDELLGRFTPEGDPTSAPDEATLRFVTQPAVFSETCAVVCEALYDFLAVEGFLDLPVAWRAALDAGR